MPRLGRVILLRPIALALILAACGGSSGESGTTAPQGGTSGTGAGGDAGSSGNAGTSADADAGATTLMARMYCQQLSPAPQALGSMQCTKTAWGNCAGNFVTYAVLHGCVELTYLDEEGGVSPFYCCDP